MCCHVASYGMYVASYVAVYVCSQLLYFWVSICLKLYTNKYRIMQIVHSRKFSRLQRIVEIRGKLLQLCHSCNTY